jgi:hypothetical protein
MLRLKLQVTRHVRIEFVVSVTALSILLGLLL